LTGVTPCAAQVVPAGARQTWPSRVKAMAAARLAGEEPGRLEKFTQALTATGCMEWSLDPVHETFHRPHLDFESEPPHVFATLWFEPELDLRAIFETSSAWSEAAMACIERGAVWRCDPLPIIG
jgi:hypothetical protein